MADLMEEVLLLSRVEAGKVTFFPRPLDVAEFCQRLVDEITSATGKRCPIVFTASLELPKARGDESLLRHIFTNLLNNAVKFSPRGSPVEFNLKSEGLRARFTVRDRGVGIPEADAKQLFQAFHRCRNASNIPGTGLGMVIVKRCVELHEGTIFFESEEGQGTTFTVELPLFRTEQVIA
jgi:signal transduction histidine kinase